MSQNQAIKKKVEQSDSEQEQTTYVQITPAQLKIIQNKKKQLAANTSTNTKGKESVQQKQKKGQSKQQAKKLKPVIEDDRQKIKPTFVSKVNNQKEQQSKNSVVNQKKQSKKSYSNEHKKVTNYTEKQKNNQNFEEKQKYQEKNEINYRTKNQNKSEYQPNKNYSRKYQQKADQRRQRQREDYIIQRVYPKRVEAQNLIHMLPDKVFEDLVQELLKKLKKCQFVQVKAIGSQITRAFEVVEEMKYHFDRFDRINIPGTVQIQKIYIPRDKRSGLKQFTKMTKKAEITIEVSLDYLDNRHIGFQQYNKKTLSKVKKEESTSHRQEAKYQQKQKPKPQYRQKQRQRFNNSNNYSKRGNDKQKQKYQQKQYDERDYR